MMERYNKQDGGPAIQTDSGEIATDPDERQSAIIGERSTESNLGGQSLGQISGADGERRTSRTQGDADAVEEAGETVAADIVSAPPDTRPVGSDTMAWVGGEGESEEDDGKK